MNKTKIYTRNLEPLTAGSKLVNISIYNNLEEEIDLHLNKNKKIYITVPSFTNQAIMKEVEKLDIILKDYPKYDCYLISNEPVFTQNRLLRNRKLQTFKNLSDYKNRNFARYTGTHIYEIEKLVKSVFVVDENDYIKFVKYYDDLYSNIDANELIKNLD